jgi:eukaryotic-like serine/threonine-protein kinase
MVDGSWLMGRRVEGRGSGERFQHSAFRIPHSPFGIRHSALGILRTAAALLLLAPAPSRAADWPIFRGDPSLRGVASDELSLPLRKVWAVRVATSTRSSPVIAQGQIVIGADDGVVRALALEDGKTNWSFKCDGAVEAPPLVAGDAVVVGSEKGTLYALRLSEGTLSWNVETGDRIAGSANLVEIDGRRLAVAGNHANQLVAVDLKDGTRAWTCEADNYINGTPALAGDTLVFGSCDANVYTVAVSNGVVRHRIDTGSYIAASPAADGRFAAVGNFSGWLTAIDVEAGAILWRYGETNGAAFFSSPALTKDLVIAGRRDGSVHAVRRSDGSRAWTFTAKEAVDSSPVVCGDHVAFGSDDGRVYILRLQDGKEAWTYELGAPISAAIAIANRRLIVLATDGWLTVFAGASR